MLSCEASGSRGSSQKKEGSSKENGLKREDAENQERWCVKKLPTLPC